MDKNVNQIITEAMGECWHEWDDNPSPLHIQCCKCGVRLQRYVKGHSNPLAIEMNVNTDYQTPEGFFKCWRWAQKQEWWKEFICTLYYHDYNNQPGDDVQNDYPGVISVDLIDHQTFATTLANFLQEREK